MKRTLIIAEAGVNHNGSVDLAKQLIDQAAKAGADAVKFQTFRADKGISRRAPKAEYQIHNTGADESQYEMVKKLELTEEDHLVLVQQCRERKISFLSTPFDLDSVDVLERLKVPKYKVASGEITNAPLLLKVARTGKPIVLSTGMCTLGDIETGLGIIAFGYLYPDRKPSLAAFRDAYCSEMGRQALKDKVSLLHCTTEYPARFADVNLRAMDTLTAAFGLPVGLSDHTMGISVAIAAAARGAAILEKHFTLDQNLPGPDHKASIEPYELRNLVESVRQIEEALGSPEKLPAPVELATTQIVRKSLVAAKPVKLGELFCEDNIGIKRPETGLAPAFYWELIGRMADRDYQEDEPIGQSALQALANR